MMREALRGCLVIAWVVLLSPQVFAQTEVTVFVGGAMTRPAREAGAAYERSSGNTVVLESDTTGELQKRLSAGEKADLIIVTAPAIEALQQKGLVRAESRVDLARALIGVGVHPDGSLPDLSTPDTFKAALLAARSVAYVSPAAGGTSGTYFEGLLKRMGIADAMKAKIVYQTQGAGVAEAVASGKAEIGITFTSELRPNPGVKVAGTLPTEIQLPTIYAGAVTTAAPNPEAARAFLGTLAGAAGRAAFIRIGLEPIDPAR